MVLKLINISKSYGDRAVIKNISLECERELISLLGPSGCGKTTLLRIIAGFETLNNGRIILNEDDITNLPPHKRNVGMVFQNYALFPHLNVFENIAYGLKVRGLKPNEIKEKVKNVLSLVNLEGFENYMIYELSGGMQQRVAVARALVIEPEVLLLDEPLSNLDAKLRVKMRKELKKLQRTLGITTIYVTHDQEEAMAISDRVAIMNNGMIEQVDTPQNIYKFPKTPFVANFIGSINELSKVILDSMGIEYNKKYFYFIRPEHVTIGKGNFVGKIEDVEYLGNLVRYTINFKDIKLISEVHGPKIVFKENKKVSFEIKKDHILKIPKEISRN
ncbi:ABC transporter related protein [Methanocaldococcus infernus ME]|uniref:Molybdate/tungstate import ATP-binding protein WtpC n=1 Tax=Methanocaldococcus infernus (strain DSM 11812 / JCM 15783 / ME) TaxID=573063 RepID=D5VT45_METIM|nr:ABC transporter ATP-binding protein [Methanocaldococcus infernus]ADG13748.1 ABC transporter related protein [Methanocaldococcus infernus ME]